MRFAERFHVLRGRFKLYSVDTVILGQKRPYASCYYMSIC